MVTALVLAGPWEFWCAAFAGHVVATIVTYAAVGVLCLVARQDAARVIDAPGYGTSRVWAGTLGLVIGHQRHHLRWGPANVAAVTASGS